MPRQESHSSYPVTTALMVALAVLFGAGAMLKEFVPPPPLNGLVADGEDYLEAGAHQDVQWRALGPEVFSEARRLDRPVLLVIGDMSSRLAREADRDAFSDPEITAMLRRSFVCVRVDASQYPEWVSAFLPVRRTVLGFDTGFQVWVLDPAGKMVGSAVVRSAGQRMGGAYFLPILRNCLIRLGEGQRDPAVQRQFGSEQSEDLAILHEGDATVVPDIEGHRSWLAEQTDAESGGWPQFGFQALAPNAYGFLLATGDLETLSRSLDPVLRTPVVDWLDGGFFVRSSRPDWQAVEFDKFAVQNAEMMAFLAKAWRITGVDLYRRLAEDTFDSLAGSFVQAGLPAGYRIGDERADGRSRRSSFSVRQVREALAPADRERARTMLGLRVESNPQMAICVPDSSVIRNEPKAFDELLERLRAAKERLKPVYGGVQQLDASGTTVARMIEAARILDDAGRLAMAFRLFDRLYRFRIGPDDVFHANTPSGRSYRYLGDYLAFADAALEDYLAFGRVVSARDGLRVLRRALFIFAGPTNGSILDGQENRGALDVPDVPSDALADDIGESNVAKALRLCQAYSCLFRSLDPTVEFADQGLELRRMALAITSRYAQAANQLHRRMSGFFRAAKAADDDVFAMCTGPDPLSLARQLGSRVPTRLVAPAYGRIRPIIQSRGSGVFIVRDGVPEGPLTVDEAARALR